MTKQMKMVKLRLDAIMERPAEFRPSKMPSTISECDKVIKAGLLKMAQAGYPRPR